MKSISFRRSKMRQYPTIYGNESFERFTFLCREDNKDSEETYIQKAKRFYKKKELTQEEYYDVMNEFGIDPEYVPTEQPAETPVKEKKGPGFFAALFILMAMNYEHNERMREKNRQYN